MTEQNLIKPFTDNIYEHPFGERIKLLLRLEIIFAQAIEHKSARDQYETQMCLDALFALLNLTNRYELRSVMLKELERIGGLLQHLKKSQKVSMGRVEKTLADLAHCKTILHSLDSKHIDRLRNIEFLNAIKLRNIHETGSYLFEIPELQHWLLQNAEHRAEKIEQWLNDFTPFKTTIDFLLQLVRDSAKADTCTAAGGIYIKTAESKAQTNKLLRIIVDERHDVYPSVSGDGYRFVVRFMEHKQADTRALQTKKSIDFKLFSCGI